MTQQHQLGFDDRWLMALGIPVIGFLAPVLFYGASPRAMGWADFAPEWLVGTLYTATYWTLARWIIRSWRCRCPGLKRTSMRVAKTVATLVVVVLAVEAACRTAFGWNSLLKATDYAGKDLSVWQTAPASLLLVLAMSGVYEAIYYFELYRRTELDRERLLRAQVETQLDALSKQVDPHFLFNSLNTLVAIIPEDAAAAVAFTQRLSAVYRRLLDWRHAGTVSVREELDALADYLHLLEVRFEDRLRVEVSVDPALYEHRVVPLALQILVENVVKHNEVSHARPMHVRVTGHDGVLTVTNALQPKAAERSTGFGLQNLRDRLSYLGDRALEVSSHDGAFAVALPVYAASEVAALQATS